MQRAYDENNPPDALERIFQGPLNWMNLVIIGVNILVFAVMEICGDTQDINFMLKWGAAYTPWILDGEGYRLFTSMFLHFGLEHLLNNMMLLLFLGDTLEELVTQGGLNQPDQNDRASLEADKALELRTRDRARKLISKINEALQRIEDGVYGYCEDTGEPIGIERLEARPIATLSIEAQERHERMEKTYDDEA